MIKAIGCDGILAELFQILKDDAVKVLHSIGQQIGKTQQWPQVSFPSNPKEGQCQSVFKLLHNCNHFTYQQGNAQNPSSQASIAHESRTSRFLNVQAVFRKGREPEITLPTSFGSQKKQGNFRKTSTSALLTTLKPSTACITRNCRKFFKRWDYQTTLPAS